MFKPLFTSLCILSFSWASLFTITDQLGNGNFIHNASKEKGIIISPLTDGSYAETFVSARRVAQRT